jgi:hypothetical protein
MAEYQPIEKSPLEAFYHQTGGDYWYDNTRWLDEKTPHCQWFGLARATMMACLSRLT